MTQEGVSAVENLAGSVRVEIEESRYPLEAVYAAAYVFIDRAFVLLDRPRAGTVRVTLADKREGSAARDEAALRAVVDELSEQLLSTARRHRIAAENRELVLAITTQAIAPPSPAAPSLDELEAFDFTSDTFEDPLGIAQSWEEKYRKKAPADPEPTTAAEAKKEESK